MRAPQAEQIPTWARPLAPELKRRSDEEEKERRQRRVALVLERRELTEQLGREAKPQAKRVQEATEKVALARAAYEEAGRRLARTRQEIASATYQTQVRLGLIDAELRTSASPAIALLVQRIDDVIAAIRHGYDGRAGGVEVTERLALLRSVRSLASELALGEDSPEELRRLVEMAQLESDD